MIIKKLELQGFKSFPERTKVVFHSGITAIVGPNGTGKSNIVDAIMWVLGGQRQKGLRGEKTEDIIFNGNAKKPALGMADVSLGLEHEQDEIVINHRAFRSGESEYRLNGKAARLKDIQDTLWKRAVAEKEYFVIEQGSVGAILTTKPAEKRALLDEAAGTAFFKDKKKEAQGKLASSEQNLIRLEDIISEVSRSKNSLQRQAQAAVRYRKLREKTRELTGLNYRRKLIQLEHRHEEALRLHTDALTREKDIAAQIRMREKDLADRRREVWELEKAIKESQETLYQLESQLNRAEAERDREAKSAGLLLDKGKKAASSAEELEQEAALFDSEIGQKQQARSELERQLQEKREDVARAADDSRTVRESFSLVEKNLEDLKSQQLQKLFDLTELRNESLKGEKEIELLLRQETKLNVQLVQEESLLGTKEESLRLIDGELAEARAGKEEMEKQGRDLRASLEERRSAVTRLKEWIEETRRSGEEDRYRLNALKKMEEQISGPAASEDVPEALGRLADLIEAEAADIALVDALWQEEAGLPVIPAMDFLRRIAERPLQGRFILVSGSQEQESPQPEIADPGVLGYLKSRLRPGPKIKGLLGQLRDAVIVRDIRSAIELWQRHPALNFVTPQGDVLLSSGLIKLGRREEGAFALGQEMRDLEDRLTRREAELAPLSAELDRKGQEVARLDEDIAAAALAADELVKKIHEIEKKRIADEAEKEKAASAVAILRKELEILGQDKSVLSLSRESLLQQIGGLEADELALKARIEAEERDFSAHRGRDIEEEKRTIGLRSDIALLEERLGHLDRQMQELGERKEAVSKKILSFREESESARKEEVEAREAAAALETRSKAHDEEKKTRQADLVQKESDLLRQRTEAETLEKGLAESREELERKKEERVKWEIAKAEIDRDMVNLEESCWQELKKTLHEVRSEKPEVELSDAEIDEQLAEAEEDLQRIKTVNLMAEEEYISHKERYDFLVHERDDLRQSIDATQEAIRKIDEESQTQFLTALHEVNKNFQEIFTLLFKGGNAEVKLVDEANMQESGVEIIAQPPGKKVQNVQLLSGGEKSLTSLAFLFALFRYKPTPFCILDEVDAALDDVNLTRFLDLMKEIKKGTQFIIITHNYKTMEVADYIYGTTMAEPNITKLYSVKLEKQQELIQ
jgi:chromosome segregation protein